LAFSDLTCRNNLGAYESFITTVPKKSTIAQIINIHHILLKTFYEDKWNKAIASSTSESKKPWFHYQSDSVSVLIYDMLCTPSFVPHADATLEIHYALSPEYVDAIKLDK
jgi:hypothetical protein